MCFAEDLSLQKRSLTNSRQAKRDSSKNDQISRKLPWHGSWLWQSASAVLGVRLTELLCCCQVWLRVKLKLMVLIFSCSCHLQKTVLKKVGGIVFLCKDPFWDCTKTRVPFPACLSLFSLHVWKQAAFLIMHLHKPPLGFSSYSLHVMNAHKISQGVWAS